jgi:hypothetical protein
MGPRTLILLPVSTQLAYATYTYTGDESDHEIAICDIPPDILSNIGTNQGQSALPKVRIYSCLPCPFNNFLWRILQGLLKVYITSFSRFVLTDLQTDATLRPARVRRNPAASPFISLNPRPPRPLLARDPQRSALVRHLRKLLRRSSHTDPPLDNQPCDPLDVRLLSCFCGD